MELDECEGLRKEIGAMAEDGIVGSSAGVGEGVKSAFEPLVAVVDFHHARYVLSISVLCPKRGDGSEM